MDKGTFPPLASRSGSFSIEDILNKNPRDESTGGRLNFQSPSSGPDFKTTTMSDMHAVKATVKAVSEDNAPKGKGNMFVCVSNESAPGYFGWKIHFILSYAVIIFQTLQCG